MDLPQDFCFKPFIGQRIFGLLPDFDDYSLRCHILVQALYKDKFTFPLDKYLSVRFLGDTNIKLILYELKNGIKNGCAMALSHQQRVRATILRPGSSWYYHILCFFLF